MDLDFDYLRTSIHGLGVSREVQLKLYAQLALRYAQEGYNVLLNEPSVVRACPGLLVDIMFLPDGRLINHCARKLRVDATTVWNWRLDWMTIATRFDIPIITSDAFLGPFKKQHDRENVPDEFKFTGKDKFHGKKRE